jgi:putative nucleotidyltransferase with HDIG domain
LLQAFLLDFWKVLALSLLVVSLLVVSQVRRQMHPLVALTAATRRLAARDFSTPVAVSSGDEFEELGASFNQLSAELGRQFAELEAFSQGTLEALARTIDAKSHWTAGHSERVTTMAVALALEMQLPEAEVTLLRRGGLVHDIGKLATPQEILDKAEMLTQEEEIIMRNHTLDGVHILEPIPAFRALLPIVEQHHERWDGRGYPHGLAGVNIARTARVLAVADVFDAMRSDRPYRTGMPRANVVTMIRAGAGTHFDPDVVVAFVRLMAADTGRSCEELAG